MSRSSNERQAFDLIDSPVSREATRPSRPDRRKPAHPLTSYRPLALVLIGILLAICVAGFVGSFFR